MFDNIPSPCYVIEENLLRKNLSKIKEVKDKSGAEIILAFKSFATWKTFPIFKEYIGLSTASSLSEALLAYNEMGSKAHTYAPVYKDSEFDEIVKCSSHITFNSIAQFNKYADRTIAAGVSCGVRINPEHSDVETDLYNPCTVGTRFGLTIAELENGFSSDMFEKLDGFHFHTLCESNSFDLEKTLKVVEEKFSHLFNHIKWINFGGGHLMTHKDYDTNHLIELLKAFKNRYPHLDVILEPGSAFTWRTGFLLATIEDIVENGGIKTAILDVSFSCHMPDCLEMPYKPAVRLVEERSANSESKYIYRLGGNSCLSGDFIEGFEFSSELKVGDRLIFEDMIHYTTVKTTYFNGVSHPSIGIIKNKGGFELYREFDYNDFKNRLC